MLPRFNWVKVLTVFFSFSLFLGMLIGRGMSEEKKTHTLPFEGIVSSKGAKAAKYIGMQSCIPCHEKEYGEYLRSTHAKILIPGQEKVQGCEMCHGPGSVHVDEAGGRKNIIDPRTNPSTCMTCHMDKVAEFKLPFHHPVLEGKMSCSSCHLSHAEDVRSGTFTSLNNSDAACFKCHKEQRGPFVWEHLAMREGCTLCHKVHGSIHQNLLWARDNNLCLRCHTQLDFPNMGRVTHATFLPQGPCFSGGCHTAVHGSNFDEHLRY